MIKKYCISAFTKNNPLQNPLRSGQSLWIFFFCLEFQKTKPGQYTQIFTMLDTNNKFNLIAISGEHYLSENASEKLNTHGIKAGMVLTCCEK